jgi:hypothetical protein
MHRFVRVEVMAWVSDYGRHRTHISRRRASSRNGAGSTERADSPVGQTASVGRRGPEHSRRRSAQGNPPTRRPRPIQPRVRRSSSRQDLRHLSSAVSRFARLDVIDQSLPPTSRYILTRRPPAQAPGAGQSSRGRRSDSTGRQTANTGPASKYLRASQQTGQLRPRFAAISRSRYVGTRSVRVIFEAFDPTRWTLSSAPWPGRSVSPSSVVSGEDTGARFRVGACCGQGGQEPAQDHRNAW